ncbi:MAG: sigma-70 family RNA polymerase sigma factor [Sphaerobacter sp.]|nr:sigma-70 family RNA polymerase sigma factor [Sphaerobacter sp.]
MDVLRGYPIDGATPQDAVDEEALVERARRDPRAFAVLYARYADPVYRFCYRRLGEVEAAEDATSQVFLKALAALPRYRAGSFRSWLFTIAYHVVADRYRERRPDRLPDTTPEPIDPGLTPEEALLHSEAHRSVRALLARLSPEQREVVELRLAGLNGAEIARVLGRSHGSVRALQYRAAQRLRAALDLDTERGGAGCD